MSVHAVYYRSSEHLFAKSPPFQAIFDDEPGCMSEEDFLDYIRNEVAENAHISLRMGNSEKKETVMNAVLKKRPKTLYWEFGDGDDDDICDTISRLDDVPSVSVNFSDRKLTLERMLALATVARHRKDRHLKITAFDMMPECFASLVGVFDELTERFKTALVCVAACNRKS
nr:hypothetical protein TetV2_00328 [Oceanusvirus sp.]